MLVFFAYLTICHLTEGLTAWQKLLKMELGSSVTTLRFWHPKCADPILSQGKNETQGNFGRCSPNGRPNGLAKTTKNGIGLFKNYAAILPPKMRRSYFFPKEIMKRKVILADAHLTEDLTAWRKLLFFESWPLSKHAILTRPSFKTSPCWASAPLFYLRSFPHSFFQMKNEKDRAVLFSTPRARGWKPGARAAPPGSQMIPSIAIPEQTLNQKVSHFVLQF